ncbi:winged helix-turn-helix domain-containing protein [Pedobacter sp. MR2016-24]|uniref:winged helix-turn-helix domain-containing protein n=1 Tax=Pedobacter sp. MR2016-24 TaxID=2994466 RepID=UPI002245F21B|nr:crosslink repair DNA glycosylase YcaQ family protein [Pedobacter sp. MR2016-24]MCX2484701.1 winged helix DNA-binding domain-containing protein [Pedobacter sp. MR2016-24]
MESVIMTKAQARRIILHAAGLATREQFGTGIEAVYQLIDHLGFVQLDTNYVVERAHHHVMAARVPDYEPEWLEELSAEGRIFEYFTSDAGYIPMHDFRFSLPVKQAFAKQRKPMTKEELNLMKHVLDRIEREGQLMVGDFDDDRVEASSGWWDWRPAKVALERLYLDGELVISRTKGFKKVYDLPMNLIPEDTDLSVPAAEEYARYVIRRTLGALGIAAVKEIAWRARHVKGNLVKKELEQMVAEGLVNTVVVEGLKAAPLYMLSDQKREIVLSGDAFILSPFDILNVFRHRLRDFFDFDYQIECFVPAAKRKYGYFSLPILIGDVFVARMDAKADRKQKVLIVHNLHFEEVILNKEMTDKLADALKSFILFNQCRDIIFKKSNREDELKAISQHF